MCTLPKEVDEELIAFLRKHLNTYQRIAFSKYHQGARDYFRIGALNKEGIRIEGSVGSPYLYATLKKEAIERFYRLLKALEKEKPPR